MIGIDIVSTARFRNTPKDQLQKWMTDREIEYCMSKHYPHQHIAARWAAKEAFIKAKQLSMSVGMKNIEVVHRDNGSPFLVLHNDLKVHNQYQFSIHVSLSHTVDYATAVVMVVQTI